MMQGLYADHKVGAEQLQRRAYLYVRQSTIKQLFENRESTQRQYALRERAVGLGWPEESITVIDCDQGRSGASMHQREGFKKLVSEVALGKAGIVMGLEVSRLARNNSDWHRLLELCSISGTLILDEDGLYDPAHFNDRLLLGLKGTMSEVELHLLKSRLRGGLLNKARRGELKVALPVGLVYDLQDRVVLDPDRQIQETVRQFFATFKRTGAARATVEIFGQEGLVFPRRLGGKDKPLVWERLTHGRALSILHNPRYAGAFVYGRHKTGTLAEGKQYCKKVAQEHWAVLIKKAHPGYISWEEYEQNVERLRQNAQALGHDRASPPREGPALLQGLALCGKCGGRMRVRYHKVKERLIPAYVCQRRSSEMGSRSCQYVGGGAVDAAIGKLLVETLTPFSLEVVLNVQKELQGQFEQTRRLRQKQVERARYEADQAKYRYLQVDAGNRLVAASLEADWNEKLRSLCEAHQQYEKQCRKDRQILNEKDQSRILSLAEDFPKLWNDPHTTDRDRKRMARLMLEDVTLFRDRQIHVHVRFKGGKTQSLRLSLSPNASQRYKTKPQVVEQIDHLLNEFTYSQIADKLNARGWQSGTHKPFTRAIVKHLRRLYGLKTRSDRLKEKGLLSKQQVADLIGCHPRRVHSFKQQGLLRAIRIHEKGQYLYYRPNQTTIEQLSSTTVKGKNPVSVTSST